LNRVLNSENIVQLRKKQNIESSRLNSREKKQTYVERAKLSQPSPLKYLDKQSTSAFKLELITNSPIREPSYLSKNNSRDISTKVKNKASRSFDYSISPKKVSTAKSPGFRLPQHLKTRTPSRINKYMISPREEKRSQVPFNFGFSQKRTSTKEASLCPELNLSGTSNYRNLNTYNHPYG